MDLAVITMLASLTAAFGGRAQQTVAHLSAALGRAPGLLVVAVATSALTAAVMAFAGAWLSSQFVGLPRAAIVIAALALAAIELARPVRLAAPKEPTRSLGAIALALLWQQLFDAPRLLVFAAAAALANATPALWGGAIGASIGVTLGWAASPALQQKLPIRFLRLALSACTIVAAISIALIAHYTGP